MAWIGVYRKKDGTVSYFVHDVRDGRSVSIAMPSGTDRAYAELMKERYELRQTLERRSYQNGLD